MIGRLVSALTLGVAVVVARDVNADGDVACVGNAIDGDDESCLVQIKTETEAGKARRNVSHTRGLGSTDDSLGSTDDVDCSGYSSFDECYDHCYSDSVYGACLEDCDNCCENCLDYGCACGDYAGGYGCHAGAKYDACKDGCTSSVDDCTGCCQDTY